MILNSGPKSKAKESFIPNLTIGVIFIALTKYSLKISTSPKGTLT